MPAAPADLSLDYRWSAGSLPPPHHYAVRIRLDADGAEVALRPGYAGADTPTWTVPLTPTASDREVLVTALREAGLFEADWTPRRPRHIGGSGWTLRVTAEGRSVSVPRDAVAEAGDPAAVEAAVRALVPDAVWADLRARRQAFIAAPG